MPGADNILIYNNGQGRPDGDYSTINEIVPPLNRQKTYDFTIGTAYGPTESVWIYKAANPTDFYGMNISGTQRLANGNTLICEGPNGRFFEVTESKQIVWEYINPVAAGIILSQEDPIPSSPMGQKNQVFRCYRYAPDYPGLAGNNLTPGNPIEKDAYPITLKNPETNPSCFQVWSTAHKNEIFVSFSLDVTANVYLHFYDLSGKKLFTRYHQQLSSGIHQLNMNLATFTDRTSSMNILYAVLDISTANNIQQFKKQIIIP
ncbi:MAG: hypothetical protein HQK83_20670 [Fibrobacteria bacterium]|nr:hypothetical protein [Fibrobacteria bacterium]